MKEKKIPIHIEFDKDKSSKYYTLYKCAYCGSQYRDLDKCPNCSAPSTESIKLKTHIDEAQEKGAQLAMDTVELILYRICSVLCCVTFWGWICSPGMIVWTLIRQLGFKKKFDKFAFAWMIGCAIFCVFLISFAFDTFL